MSRSTDLFILKSLTEKCPHFFFSYYDSLVYLLAWGYYTVRYYSQERHWGLCPLYIHLSIAHLSSYLCAPALFCHANTFCPAGEGGKLGWADLCPSCRRVPCMDRHGSHCFAKYFCKYWIIGRERRDYIFTVWMISDRFKEVYLAQAAPRASHLSEQRPTAVCHKMLLPGWEVHCRFLTNHLLHHVFS